MSAQESVADIRKLGPLQPLSAQSGPLLHSARAVRPPLVQRCWCGGRGAVLAAGGALPHADAEARRALVSPKASGFRPLAAETGPLPGAASAGPAAARAGLLPARAEPTAPGSPLYPAAPGTHSPARRRGPPTLPFRTHGAAPPARLPPPSFPPAVRIGGRESPSAQPRRAPAGRCRSAPRGGRAHACPRADHDLRQAAHCRGEDQAGNRPLPQALGRARDLRLSLSRLQGSRPDAGNRLTSIGASMPSLRIGAK